MPSPKLERITVELERSTGNFLFFLIKRIYAEDMLLKYANVCILKNANQTSGGIPNHIPVFIAATPGSVFPERRQVIFLSSGPGSLRWLLG